jgi:hypothetical protein
VAPAPRAGVLLWGPGVGLLAAALVLGFAPGLAGGAVEHAHEFMGTEGAATTFRPGAGTYAWALGAALGALLVAWLGLYRRRLPRVLRAAADRGVRPGLDRLKLLHDGVVGEYVTWLTVGAALLGGLFAVLIR